MFSTLGSLYSEKNRKAVQGGPYQTELLADVSRVVGMQKNHFPVHGYILMSWYKVHGRNWCMAVDDVIIVAHSAMTQYKFRSHRCVELLQIS